jgi:CDGSH-type Zn-finger protein
MDKRHIAAKQPAQVELEAGKTYAWCACGLSANQPYCDGTHQKGDLRPIVFKAEKSETAWLCQCKQTGSSPFCDGTHNNL